MSVEVISADEREELAKRAYDIDQEIRGSMSALRQNAWGLASQLYEFDEMQGWLLLDCETKSEWLADPQITLSQTTYYDCVRCWRELVVTRRVKPERLARLDITKVRIVLPAIEAGTVTVRKALSDAEALGARDLRETYGKQKALPAAGNGLPAADEIDQDEGDFVQAEKDWRALADELIAAMDSGQPKPRINAQLINAGVHGADLLIAQWRTLEHERGED